MATFDGSDLKAWRKAQGISAAELAARISCDETTIFRYESGKLKPDPDVMYQICRELGDTRRWQFWMVTEYPISYGREHPVPIMFGLEGSVLKLFSDVRDLKDLKRAVMEESADGVIQNSRLKKDLLSELEELIQDAQGLKALLEGDGTDGA